MPTALLVHWSNLIEALQARGVESPLAAESQSRYGEAVVEWYGTFTDVPAEALQPPAKAMAAGRGKTAAGKASGYAAILAGVEFLKAWLEPAEMVNMSLYGADRKTAGYLRRMVARMGEYHADRLDGLGWLVAWLGACRT